MARPRRRLFGPKHAALRAALFGLVAIGVAGAAGERARGEEATSTGAAAVSVVETTVSHGVSAFGDLKYAPDFAHFDYVNPNAPKGGRLSMRPTIGRGTFDSFNPYILRGDAADGAQFLFDTLMARAFDEPDAAYGLLAESVETPADRSFAVFTLRAAARFADDSPVTAEDVAWSIIALRDQGGPIFATALRNVVAVEALDARRVRFDFNPDAPTRDMPATVASMPIFAKAHFENRAFDEASLVPPLGSGPYRVGEYEPGRFVVYERREDYWARDLPVRRGQFNFDALRYEYFLDHDVAYEAFRSGEFDLNEVFISRNWATKYDFDAVNQGWIRIEELPDGRPSGTQGFWINTRRTHLSDPRVREALDLAFDFEWANRTLFYELYTRTEGLFANSNFEAEGPAEDAERALLAPFAGDLPDGALERAYRPPSTDGTGRNRGNLRRAARLLEAAGWRVVDGVRVNAQGEPLEIEFLDRVASSLDRIVDPYIQNLSRIGVQARLRQVDPAQYELRVKSFDFDIITRRYVMAATPGTELAGYFSSSAADQEGSFNIAGVRSPAIDAMIERIEAAETRDDLTIAARALDRAFRSGHYWIPHWYKASHNIAYWDRFGRPQDLGLEKPPYNRGIIATWWFDPDRAAALEAARGR